MKRIDIDRINRVVVRGTNWVGDAVMTVPVLRELRRVLPRAHITLATRAWARDIFADADFIDEILVLEKESGASEFLKQIRELRAQHFDLAVLFPNSFAPAFTAFAARVPCRIGYNTSARSRLLTHALEVPAWKNSRHEVFYYLNIVAELEKFLRGTTCVPIDDKNLHNATKPNDELRVSVSRQIEAREILRSHGARLKRKIVVICPGSTNSRAKRWQVESYGKLADLLFEEANAEIVLIGAREEIDVTNEVVAHMKNQPIVLTGATTLAGIVAVLSVCDLLISNDTGPAHIAAALQRPTLVIFGPTNPTTTRPFSDTAEIIRHPPDCAPCMLRDCPIDHRCMTAIRAEEVFARAVAMLNKTDAGCQIPDTGKRQLLTSDI